MLRLKAVMIFAEGDSSYDDRVLLETVFIREGGGPAWEGQLLRLTSNSRNNLRGDSAAGKREGKLESVSIAWYF